MCVYHCKPKLKLTLLRFDECIEHALNSRAVIEY